jgi:hypothetical protein
MRQQLGRDKQQLKSLHRSSSYAQSRLTIREARGLKAIVRNAAEQALPLAFSLALIAVPLLVLALSESAGVSEQTRDGDRRSAPLSPVRRGRGEHCRGSH